MANSEIKAAVRTFYREKAYALINLSGLSLAIACCLILGLYLKSELTYDQHHLRHKQIYRITLSAGPIGAVNPPIALTGVTLGTMLKDNFPEIKEIVRFMPAFKKVLIRGGDKAFYWEGVYETDKNVFDVFTHKIIYGDPKTALKDPTSAAVSETFARKYFGDGNPIGKTIKSDSTETIEGKERKITLVFKDLPENSHLKYDVLFRIGDLPPAVDPRLLLGSGVLFTYVVMPENLHMKDLQAILDSFYSRFLEAGVKIANLMFKYHIQPLADIHHDTGVAYDLPVGNKHYIFGFAAVAAFILLVACINYVNLAIARAAKRAKEIGMRRILGVSRITLVLRFLCEAIVFALIAVVIGVALVEAALKLTPVNDLLGKSLSFGLMDEISSIGWVLGLGLLVGLLSGLYPAFYLSSISPMSALAGTHGGKRRSFRLREVLVLTQFTVSVIVIGCTLIMLMQMRYITNKPLGFDKHNRVIIELRGLDVIEKYPVIKNELLKNSHILGVTVSDRMISVGTALAGGAGMADNKNGVMERFEMSRILVADDFMEVIGMKLADGRDFSKKLLTDVGTSFVVNETFAKNRGWTDSLGKRVQFIGDGGRVIGVVKDFHVDSLHGAIAPFVMHRLNDDFKNIPAAARPNQQRVMIIRIADKEVQQTLNFIQNKFSQYDPQHPFEYAFLDDMIAKLYTSEDHLMKMIGVFSGICIFISCLGLFGLTAFTTEQRSKEIGIRKVLGASVSQIILMLAWKILWLVLAGSVVASIVAYFAMDEWLSGFAYRIHIPLWVFFLSAAIVIAVAYITVALQSYKTAQTNPARTLRYE
jgi:putative ABC transport system permease protein